MRSELLAFALILFGVSAASAQTCTARQRIELAGAGYDKAEIEALCLEQAAGPSEAPPPDPTQVLMSATYDAATGSAAKRYFAPEDKCVFLEDRIRVNGKKGLAKELPYSAFSSFGLKGHRFESKRKNGIVTSHIEITAAPDSGKESCFAMLVRRRDVNADEFDAFVAEKRQEFDTVLDALKARGVAVEG